jgi:hypothetical protein
LALPATPREYHAFYRTAHLHWWHSLAALGLFVLGWGCMVLAVTVAAVLYEMARGGATPEEMADGLLTPSLFLANNLGVALAIPVAVGTHSLVFGQRPGWLFSIQGRWRWGLLGRFLAVAAGIHLVVLACWLLTAGAPDGLEVRSET